MQARWRNLETKKPELLYTIYGSGLAAGYISRPSEELLTERWLGKYTRSITTLHE